MAQVMKSNVLQEKWGPSVRIFIDEGLISGIHMFITYAEMVQGEWKSIKHVNVFNTK